MKKQTTGIHHITAFAENAQENIDFYESQRETFEKLLPQIYYK